MKKVALETVGCRLNQYETEQLALQLTSLGLERVAYKEAADLYILNSCTVTARADADCRNLISRAFRKNPKAILVVAGCYVEADKETVKNQNGVDLVIGNDEKSDLPRILIRKFPDLFPSDVRDRMDSSALSLPLMTESGLHKDNNLPNRPMVKIGDGCNQSCSYCIVPRVRGNLVSFKPDQIIAEIKSLVEAGYHEVVLTAVHIGKYRYDGLDLGGLALKILNETALSRLRFSSLEPNELTDQILELVAHEDRVCRYLHLPLQSGSDRILELMRRPYRRGDYLNVIEIAKKANPDITIGCDLIVGFPGESDDDFNDSLAVLDSGFIDYGHIFSYSDRPGTAASQMPDKINPAVIKARNATARRVCALRRANQMKRYIGKSLPVIPEGISDRNGIFWGVSDNYIKVSFPSDFKGGRHILNFKSHAACENYLIGSPA